MTRHSLHCGLGMMRICRDSTRSRAFIELVQAQGTVRCDHQWAQFPWVLGAGDGSVCSHLVPWAASFFYTQVVLEAASRDKVLQDLSNSHLVWTTHWELKGCLLATLGGEGKASEAWGWGRSVIAHWRELKKHNKGPGDQGGIETTEKKEAIQQ